MSAEVQANTWGNWAKRWADRVVCAIILDLILLGAFGLWNVWEFGVFPFAR